MEQIYINRLIADQATVHVFMANGFQMHGQIVKQDDKAIVLRRDGKAECLIYKANISIIDPAKR